MRAHKDHFVDGELQPKVFRERMGSISVDWSKYSTPEQSRQRAKKPPANAIITLLAGKIRDVDPLTVFHDPDNQPSHLWRAHSGIGGMPEDGEFKTEVRMLLLDAIVDTPIMFSE